MVAPLGRLLQNIVTVPFSSMPFTTERGTCAAFADALLVHGEREMVLHACIAGAHRMLGTVVGVETPGELNPSS